MRAEKVGWCDSRNKVSLSCDFSVAKISTCKITQGSIYAIIFTFQPSANLGNFLGEIDYELFSSESFALIIVCNGTIIIVDDLSDKEL